MALGNNLKRIKKDSLIPSKKATKSKPKESNKAKKKEASKAKPVAKNKPAPKKKVTVTKKIKVVAKKVAKPQAVTKIITKETPTNKPSESANFGERVLVGGKKDSAITIKLQPSRRKTVRKTKLIFEGSLSLLEADIIKDGLATTFNEYDIIDIQLLNITHLDITPVQLFNQFVNFYKDKKVKIDSDIPFDMKIIIERAGFGSFMFKEEAA